MFLAWPARTNQLIHSRGSGLLSSQIAPSQKYTLDITRIRHVDTCDCHILEMIGPTHEPILLLILSFRNFNFDPIVDRV